MKVLVYTCVFGGYDRVFPPVDAEPGVNYTLLTDDPDLRVRGWRTQVIDSKSRLSPKAPNRKLKMLGDDTLEDHEVSIYVDGNVRVIGGINALAASFLRTGAALGVYSHPRRQSVREELDACLRSGKVESSEMAMAEYGEYLTQGFADDAGLAETGVLLKNPSATGLDEAMRLWWSLFDRFDSRDQFSLPFVVWKTGLDVAWLPGGIRQGPEFGIYPHLRAPGTSPAYAYVAARSHDNAFHRWLLRAWHAKWRVQRHFKTAGSKR